MHIFRAAIAAAAVVCAAAIILGCGRPAGTARPPAKSSKTGSQVEPPATLTPAPKVLVESKGVGDLSWQVGGQYVLRASGETLTADEATGTATFLKARAELYRDGKRAALVSAERIDADVSAGVLTATGKVVAQSLVREIEASVAHLTWTQHDQRIVGTGGVRLKSDIGNLSADGLEADTEMDQIKLTSNTGGSASLKAAALE